MSKTHKQIKKRRGLFFGIIGAALGTLALVVLILGLVIVRPLEQFSAFSHVFVVDGFESSRHQIEGRDEVIKESLETVRFSVLRALLEGNLNHGIRPEERLNRETDEMERISYTVSQLRHIAPHQNQFMLLFTFSETQQNNSFFYYREDILTGEPQRHNIKFDRLILIIPSPNGDVQRVRLIPYLQFNIDNQRQGSGYGISFPDSYGRIGTQFYRAYEFTARMYITTLHVNLQDADFIPGGGMGLEPDPGPGIPDNGYDLFEF